MHCNVCGAPLEDGVRFCGTCGTVQPEPVSQPTPDTSGAVSYTNPNYTTPSATPVSKNKYISTLGSEKVKSANKLCRIAFIAVIVIMALALYSVLNRPVIEVAFMDMALSSSDKAEFEEIVDDMGDELDQMEDQLDLLDDDLSKSEKKALKKFIDVTKDAYDSFSMMNMKAVIDTAEEIEDIDALDDFANFEGLENVSEQMDMLLDVFCICWLIPMAFTLLGGFFKRSGLTVIAMILAAFYNLFFSGFLWLLLATAAYIVMLRALGTINKEYKAYRRGLRV